MSIKIEITNWLLFFIFSPVCSDTFVKHCFEQKCIGFIALTKGHTRTYTQTWDTSLDLSICVECLVNEYSIFHMVTAIALLIFSPSPFYEWGNASPQRNLCSFKGCGFSFISSPAPPTPTNTHMFLYLPSIQSKIQLAQILLAMKLNELLIHLHSATRTGWNN